MRKSARTALVLVPLVGLLGAGWRDLGGAASASPGAAAAKPQLSLSAAATRPYVVPAVPGALEDQVNHGRHRPAAAVPLHRITADQGRADAAKVLTDSAGTAGCALGYGRGGSCLPSVSPGSARMGGMAMDWTCPEVRGLFAHGIPLTTPGIDPQHLDHNHDQVACGQGD